MAASIVGYGAYYACRRLGYVSTPDQAQAAPPPAVHLDYNYVVCYEILDLLRNPIRKHNNFVFKQLEPTEHALTKLDAKAEAILAGLDGRNALKLTEGDWLALKGYFSHVEAHKIPWDISSAMRDVMYSLEIHQEVLAECKRAPSDRHQMSAYEHFVAKHLMNPKERTPKQWAAAYKHSIDIDPRWVMLMMQIQPVEDRIEFIREFRKPSVEEFPPEYWAVPLWTAWSRKGHRREIDGGLRPRPEDLEVARRQLPKNKFDRMLLDRQLMLEELTELKTRVDAVAKFWRTWCD